MWTIVHPIDDSSPLYGLSKIDFDRKHVEFIILIKAFDESTSQTVYCRFSYNHNEVKWRKKFAYIAKRNEHGISVDLSRMNELVDADLN